MEQTGSSGNVDQENKDENKLHIQEIKRANLSRQEIRSIKKILGNVLRRNNLLTFFSVRFWGRKPEEDPEFSGVSRRVAMGGKSHKACL